MKRRTKKQIIKSLIGFSFLFLILYLILSIINNDYFKYQQVNIVGIKDNERQKVLNYTSDYLKQKKFWLIDNNNSFLFPNSNFRQKLKERFIWIETINFLNTENQDLSLKIKKFNTESYFCLNHSKEECYLLNQEGRLFQKPATLLRSENLMINYFCQECHFSLGDYFLNKELIFDLFSFVEYFNENQKYKIKEVNIFFDAGSFDFDDNSNLVKNKNDLSLILENGSMIIFNLDDNLQKIILRINLVSENKLFDKYLFDEISVFDIRKSDRFFFK